MSTSKRYCVDEFKRLKELEKKVKNGTISDGYHTFNDLYDERLVLTAALVSMIPDRCYKTKKHFDGSMFDGMFLVSVDTPMGEYGYHYDMKHYDMFRCKEQERGNIWDGYTDKDRTRLLSLKDTFMEYDKEFIERSLRDGVYFYDNYIQKHCVPDVEHDITIGKDGLIICVNGTVRYTLKEWRVTPYE